MDLKARPTVYNGIKMRSRLEAQWAAGLDARGLKWVYEPRCYADKTRQYLPDFEVQWANDSPPEYQEIKGRCDDPIPVLARMAVIWLSEPDAQLALWVAHSNRVWMGYHTTGWSEGVWHSPTELYGDDAFGPVMFTDIATGATVLRAGAA